MNDYTGGELMAAILSLQEATAAGLAKNEAATERLRFDMNRRFDGVYERFGHMDERFDHMDARFDRLEGRVAALEPREQHPSS